MGRTAGTPNKVTAEVRGKLENLIEGLINSIQIEELNNTQKLKMLQIALQYTLPRLQASIISNEVEDLPLFIEDIKKSAKKLINFIFKSICKKKPLTCVKGFDCLLGLV